MTLDELIKALESLPQEKVVDNGFGYPMSWRGDYCELAFDPQGYAKIGDMLAHAKSALNATFEGYKGGEFTMDGYSDVYIAAYGELGEPINSANIKLWEIE